MYPGPSASRYNTDPDSKALDLVPIRSTETVSLQIESGSYGHIFVSKNVGKYPKMYVSREFCIRIQYGFGLKSLGFGSDPQYWNGPGAKSPDA
jgi:hypothetical protein